MIDSDVFLRLGFPRGLRLCSLTVSEQARCLVVMAEAIEGEGEQRRLFVRQFDEAAYQEIALPEGCNSLRDPIVSPTAPTMFALGMKWRDGGGNCVGVYRLRLPALAAELVCSAHRGYAGFGGSWISRLIGFATDGRRILVVRASGMSLFSYKVCVLDPDDGSVEVLADLPGVFA